MRMLLLLVVMMLKPTRHVIPADVTCTVHRDRVVAGMLVQLIGAAARPGRRAVAADAASRHRPHQQRRRRRRRRQTPSAAVRRVGRRQYVRLKRDLGPAHRPLKPSAAAGADSRQAPAGGDDRRCVTVRAVGRLIGAGRIAPLRGVVTRVGGDGRRGPGVGRTAQLPGVVERRRLAAVDDWRTTILIRRGRRRRGHLTRLLLLLMMMMMTQIGRCVARQVVRSAVMQRHRGRRVVVIVEQRRHGPSPDGPVTVGRRRRQQGVVAAAGRRHLDDRLTASSSGAEQLVRSSYDRRHHADFVLVSLLGSTASTRQAPLQLYIRYMLHVTAALRTYTKSHKGLDGKIGEKVFDIAACIQCMQPNAIELKLAFEGFFQKNLKI